MKKNYFMKAALFLLSSALTIGLHAQTSTTISYTGAMQTFTVPAGVHSITIDAYGAQGGFLNSTAGGEGGHATGELAVSPGQVLNIFVGGQGTTGAGGQNCNLLGGFNGGGNTGDTCCSNAGGGAGAGGGASDIRVGGMTLADRVIVAGGGGGAGSGSIGAMGGGLIGADGGAFNGTTAAGGSQVAGGIAGGHFTSHLCSWGTDGSLGQGGTGDGNDGGGGGSGYYGGGGGPNNGAGAGGSSYIGGVTSGSTTSGGRVGNGEIVLTYCEGGPGAAIALFNPDTICISEPIISLPVGTPSGGTYSGNGVSGSTFDPTIAGAGTHSIVYSYTDTCNYISTDTTDIVVQTCVGIYERKALNDVKISPNPTTGLVQIDLGNNSGFINYKITTIDGRVVNQKSNITSSQLSIDLTNESKGIYLLRVEENTSSRVYKIIKE